MAQYDAGSAAATYQLNTTQFEQAIDRAIKRYDDLAKAAQAAQQRSSLPAPSLPQAPQQQRTPNTTAITAETRALAALEAAQARLARSQGDTTRAANLEEQAIARLNTALKTTGITARESIAVERQLTTVLQQQERAAQQAAKARTQTGPTGGGFSLGGLAGAAGALGIGVGVSQVVGAGVAAGQEALALRETLNTLKALTGGTQDYAHVLEVARRQQVLFGGSLRDNLEGLQGLVITARSSGAELEQLINLSERLNILDPAQGTQGARIALSEALSGDPRSLALRYEIPRDALKKLTDASLDTSDRLQVLDDYLTKIGLTASVVGDRVDKDAQAFRQLGADIEGIKTDTGDALATSLSNAATGLSRLIRAYRDDPQAIAEISALLSGKSTVDTADLEKAQRTAIANRVNKALGIGGGKDGIETQTVRFAIEAQVGGADQLEAVRQQVAALIEASPQAAGAVQQLSNSLLRGEIDGAAFRDALNGLNAQYGLNTTQGRNWDNTLVSATDATKGATGATGELDEATGKLIQQYIASEGGAQNAAAATETLKNFQTDLANISDAVKNGLFTDADAAAFLASKYGEAANGAIFLINQQARLAEGEARLARQRANTQQNAPGGLGFDSPGRRGTSDVDAAVRGIQEAKAAAQQADTDRVNKAKADAANLEAARRRQIEQTGTATQRVAQAQREYNEAVAQYGKNSAQAVDAETNLTQARRSAETEARKGTKSAASNANKGLSALDQDRIQAQETLQGQLDEVNALLERGNLSEHQRNDLLEKRRKLEAEITDEIRSQQRAALDARKAAIDDAQQRLLEAREIRGLQNQAQNARASDEERQAAALRLAEIEVEQQQRAADIEDKRRKAGDTTVADAATSEDARIRAEAQRAQIDEQRRKLQEGQLPAQPPIPQQPIPGVNVPLPLALPDLSKLPALQLPTLQAPPVTVNLSVTLDQNGRVIQQQVDPGAVLRVLATQATAQNLMGGR